MYAWRRDRATGSSDNVVATSIAACHERARIRTCVAVPSSFSSLYGYGFINAGAAVDTAIRWRDELAAKIARLAERRNAQARGNAALPSKAPVAPATHEPTPEGNSKPVSGTASHADANTCNATHRSELTHGRARPFNAILRTIHGTAWTNLQSMPRRGWPQGTATNPRTDLGNRTLKVFRIQFT